LKSEIQNWQILQENLKEIKKEMRQAVEDEEFEAAA
jgi:protein-arginine kinase activator protein McsA